MAKRIWSEGELEALLLQVFDGDEEMVIVELAKKRKVFTGCCTYNYLEIGESPDPIPPCPKPKPKPPK